MRIRVHKKAEKDLDDAPKHIKKRLKEVLNDLKRGEFPGERLQNPGFPELVFYKVRIGKYRVVYVYNKKIDEIWILVVSSREKVYDKYLKRLRGFFPIIITTLLVLYLTIPRILRD